MSGGGSSGSQTTTTNPWTGQQPYLTDLYRQAQSNYQNPPQYFPGSTVVPLSQQTEQAMALQEQRALGGSGVEQGFSNYLQNSFGQGQLDPSFAAYGADQLTSGIGAGQMGLRQQQGGFGLGQASQFARAGNNPYLSNLIGNQGFSGPDAQRNFLGGPGGNLAGSQAYVDRLLGEDPTLAGRIGDINSQVSLGMDPTAQSALQATAQGDFLNANPYLDNMFADMSRQVGGQFNEITNPSINATFGAAGRTGSGLHGEAMGAARTELGQTLGDLANSVYGQNYQTERGRQLDAAGQLGQLGLGANAQSLDAAGLGANVYGQDAQRQLGGAQLGGDLFSRGAQDQLQRGQTSLNAYLQERGLGQDATQFGMQNNLQQNTLGADLFNQSQNRSLSASQGLMQGGLGGIGASTDLYGSIDQSRFRAGTLAPSQVALDYQNIDRLMANGQITEEQAGNYLQDMLDRFNYYENLPNNQLSQYSSIVQQGFPGQQTTQPGVRRNRAAGALGGAATGAYVGSVVPGIGTAVGAVVGGLAGAFL